MNEQNEGTNVRPAERNRPHTCLCGLAETPVKITHTQGQVFITLKHKAAAIQNATSRRQQNQTKNLKHEMYTCIIINMNGPNPCNHLVPGSFSAVHSIFPDLTIFHFFTAVRQTTMLSPSPPPPPPSPTSFLSHSQPTMLLSTYYPLLRGLANKTLSEWRETPQMPFLKNSCTNHLDKKKKK